MIEPRRNTVRIGLATVGVLALAGVLLADTMLVPRVEIREEEPGLFVLDAVVARALVSSLAPPVLPTSCVPDTEPEVTDQGQTFLVRYVLDCRERPLGAGDEILLPWNVDGIQLIARWADGEESQGLFGREPIGVVIRLGVLLPRNESAGESARQYFGFGARHFFVAWTHLLLVVGLAVVLPIRRVVTLLAGITAGHAISLALVDLGVPGLPMVPAEATIAGALVVLIAFLSDTRGTSERPIRSDRRDAVAVACTAALAGLVHGLGIATDLSASGLAGASLLVALFAANTGIDVVAWALGLGVCAVVRARSTPTTDNLLPLPQLLGTIGAFLMFSTMAAGMRTPGRLEQATGSYLEVEAVAATAASSGAAGAPNQLTSAGTLARPFMSYLIVEPYQVRLEVLVAVQALGEWLEIQVDGTGTISATDGANLAQSAADLLAASILLERDEHLAYEGGSRGAVDDHGHGSAPFWLGDYAAIVCLAEEA